MNNETTEYIYTDTDMSIPVMYVLVRTDIGYVHRAVQSGHAVAEFLIKYPRIYKNVRWENGTMVYLAVKDEAELIQWSNRFKEESRNAAMFVEPDWGYEPQNTAIAAIGFKGDFPTLRTIRMPVGYFKGIHAWVSRIRRSIFGKSYK